MTAANYPQQTYENVIIGYGIRGSIGGNKTYRVRRGNGFYNSILGHRYQDKFNLVIPSSINNPESEPYRAVFRAAVLFWQKTVSAAAKKEYDHRASKRLQMSGYNLFMREALKGEISMYVDRGDPATLDFITADFTKDGAWHDFDLSALIPATAAAVLLDINYDNAAANRNIMLRKKGNTNNINHFEVHTRVAAQDDHALAIVSPNANRVIEYNVSAAGWNKLELSVRGWWQ